MSILLRLDTVEQINKLLCEKINRDGHTELANILQEQYLTLIKKYEASDSNNSIIALRNYETFVEEFKVQIKLKVINKDVLEYLQKMTAEIIRLLEIHKNAIELQA